MLLCTVLCTLVFAALIGSALYFYQKDSRAGNKKHTEYADVRNQNKTAKGRDSPAAGKAKKKEWFCLPLSRRLASYFYKLNPSRAGRWRDMMDAVDPGNAWGKLLERTAYGIAWIYGGFVLAALLGAVFSAVLLFSAENERSSKTELVRPAFGDTDIVRLDVVGLSDEELPVSVPVSGQIPVGEELDQLFDKTFTKVKKRMLGENPSVDEISSNLNFTTDPGNGIKVLWESDNPDIISSTGALKKTELPREGVVVTLRCTLTIGTHVREYILPVHRILPETTTDALVQKLSEELSTRNKASREEAVLVLPASLGETGITFYERQKKAPWGLLFLCILGGTFRAVSLFEELKEKTKKRSEELLMAYPGFVFQLSVVLSCGLTVPAAWERVTNNMRRRRELTNESSYLLTEAERAMTARNTGSLETDVLRTFGQRCGHECYLRLSGYLVQNVRLGTGGLQALLSAELTSALAMRRDMALRRGEKMGTKLLLPMFVELAVVIAVLVMPAVLEM